jgi:CheY-like chemotaxis protein
MTVTARPLVLLVEDDEQNRQTKGEGFELRNCAVIGVSNANDAIREVASNHLISLAVIDVNLAHDDADASGLALARYLKNTGRRFPRAGYSAHFAEDDYSNVPPRDRSELFDEYYPRSRLNAGQIRLVLDELAEMAQQHLDSEIIRREEEVREVLYGASSDSAHADQYWRLVAGRRSLAEQADALSEVEAISLGPDLYPSLRMPIWLLVRPSLFEYEVEIVGFPILYSSAPSLDDAFDQLIELMSGFAMDFHRYDMLGESAQSLRDFLHVVLRGGSDAAVD